MTFALDTNILSCMLKEDESVRRHVDAATRNGDTLIIPPVVDYEIQRGLLARRMVKKLRQYLDFRQSIPIGVFDEEVWVKAAYVYAALSQQGKMVDEADILIAAFCLVNDYVLVTNNTRHFQDIGGLAIVNWKQ
jgi:tRNA(fMet)-specific endonuclease VapC